MRIFGIDVQGHVQKFNYIDTILEITFLGHFRNRYLKNRIMCSSLCNRIDITLGTKKIAIFEIDFLRMHLIETSLFLGCEFQGILGWLGITGEFAIFKGLARKWKINFRKIRLIKFHILNHCF